MKKPLFLPLLLLFTASVLAQPAGYIPGTQQCWTFNGRAHGYFKAEGNGERHILISFTGGGEKTCANYQNQSPQKLLRDSGINWNGRTVRAPGDTIVWEVFTIPNTNDYSLAAYATDINYFFQHIAPIDTSDHSKFHLEGLSGGVTKVWGFIVNHQSHNSPYRHIFSTTISMSGGFLSNNVYPLLRQHSVGKRHWVWHGTADTTNGLTPPRASKRIYDSLSGSKHLTFQVGGAHNAKTWDSCLSLKGLDTSTNRWLWMVANSGAPLTANASRIMNNSTREQLTADAGNSMTLLYPNPVKNSVTVNLSRLPAGTYRITVTDAMGRVQKVIPQVRDINYVLDVAALPKGMYIVQIKGGNYQVERKLLKE